MKNNLLLSALLLLLLPCTILAQEERITISGWGQVYYDAAFGSETHGSNSFAINKANITAKGNLTDRWSMSIMVQLNSQVKLKELWLQYALRPELSFRFGQIKTPFGLEHQISPSQLPLATGLTAASSYFSGNGGDPLYSGTAGRDIGLELSGDLFDSLLSYKLAILNGQGINQLDPGTTKMYGGALYIRPLDHVTLHGSYLGGEMNAMAARGEVAPGDPYDRQSLSVGLQLDFAPVMLRGEYMRGGSAGTTAEGAYLMAVGKLPRRFEVVGAVDYLRTDLAADGSDLSVSLGLQRWFAGKCRWQVEYRLETVAGAGEHPLAHHLRTQLQLAF